MLVPTKALSVRQPWSWLIVNGYKNIENRPWQLPNGFLLPQRIYVHAGKTSDVNPGPYSRTQSDIMDLLNPGQQVCFLKAKPWPLGAIIGELDIVDCVPESFSDWFEGPYGLVLANPVAYSEPIPYKGQLGLFDVVLP